MNSLRMALLAGTGLAVAAPTIAQDIEATPPPARSAEPGADDGDDFHTIVVTAGGLERLDMLAGTSVVRGEELQRNLDGQIGEVLTHVPGVSSSSFSPGASRPVLRGFSGDRVHVLVDGLGANDASNVSDDHAVAIEPLTADRIEVLRGPAVLIYGGSAIGGAVNVIDRRIPLRVPEESLHFDALLGADLASDLREGGASLDVPLGKAVAFHVDGSYRSTDDVDVPGGSLANSATETWSVGSGLAWLGDSAGIGASAGYYDTFYEIPTRPGSDEEVAIALAQWRGDFRGAVNLGGFFEQATTRWALTDYRHTELEDGEVGTTFLVDGIEGRVELIQRDRGGWHGSLGGQYSHRDFEAIGDEALVPPNTTSQYGVFVLQEVHRGPWQFELGGRYDRTEARRTDGTVERGFDTYSGAAGISLGVSDGLRLGINASHAERAPTAEELFADGPHLATQQFEIGDPNLSKERAWGVEGYLRGTLGQAQLSLAAFKTWFDDFIFLQASGGVEDGLPVYRQMQQGADYFGIEGEITVPLWRGDEVTIVADGKGDYIRATLADGSPVPRIPPLSLLGGIELQSERWDARAEVEWYAQQDRIAALETPTGSFAFVNASLAWKPLSGDDNMTVMLQAENIFDATGRRHASFTKDFVPLAGRNVKLSARMSF